MAPGTRASRVELAYLQMPRGGDINLLVDGKRVASIQTAATSKRPAFHRVELDDARHQIVVRVGGRVRLFGAILERSGGVTWENLPMVGTRFHQLEGLDADHWALQLQHRRPDLVLFQFGPNDTIAYGGSTERYRDAIARILQRLHRAVAQASCLVIGPPDRLVRDAARRLVPSPTVTRVLEAQRQAALGAHCAFWDARAAMGGPGSMRAWIAKKMVRKDLLHLNHGGSSAFASLLEQALNTRLGSVPEVRTE